MQTNDNNTGRRAGNVILFIYLGPPRGRESIYNDKDNETSLESSNM